MQPCSLTLRRGVTAESQNMANLFRMLVSEFFSWQNLGAKILWYGLLNLVLKFIPIYLHPYSKEKAVEREALDPVGVLIWRWYEARHTTLKHVTTTRRPFVFYLARAWNPPYCPETRDNFQAAILYFIKREHETRHTALKHVTTTSRPFVFYLARTRGPPYHLETGDN